MDPRVAEKLKPPAMPTATPKAAGDPLPAKLDQAPQAYWPDPENLKNVLVQDTKNKIWVTEKDPAKVKKYVLSVVDNALDKLMTGKKDASELTPKEQVAYRRLRAERDKAKGW
jgi:hypothetical protein